MNILDKIAERARARVTESMRAVSAEEMRAAAESMPRGDFAFERALRRPGLSFICECKKASPSKGLIAPDYDCVRTAREYDAAGADCISVLTEPEWFLGSPGHLRAAASAVSAPCLRKDFTVSEYMIYEAKTLGAAAVLLICSLLSVRELAEYIGICDGLGMTALAEAHDEGEVRAALSAGARVVGVNNRNLGDFTVDTDNSRRLRDLVPPGVIFVSESGVTAAEDVRRLRGMGADAVLVGEALMRTPDKRAKLAELKGEL